MFNAEASARRALNKNSLLGDREKITTIELIKKYPEGVCINSVGIFRGTSNEYPIFTFDEDSSKFFTGATELQRMVKGWLEDADGDLEAVNESLKARPVMVKIARKLTKNGYNYVTAEVVGTLQPGLKVIAENGEFKGSFNEKGKFVKATPEESARSLFGDNDVEYVDPETGEVIKAKVPF